MPLQNVSNNKHNGRFSVYLDTGEGLEILWPSDSHNRNKSKELLTGQIYWTRNDNYPAFHFCFSGYGYSYTNDIVEALREVNPKLEIQVISGWTPVAVGRCY